MKAYRIGDSLIINDNCEEALKRIPDKSIDLVLIDPPYEQDFHGGGQQRRAKDYTIVKENTEFMNYGFNYEVVFPELVRVCKIPNILVFCSNNQITKLMSWFENNKLKATLTTWKKSNACPLGNGKYISDLEFVIYARGKGAPWNKEAPSNIKYKCKVYPFVSGKGRLHPAQKPEDLITEYVTLHSLEGQKILDCYMGSGTTGYVCAKLNRKFVGIEIKENFVKVGINRIMEVYDARK